MILAASSSFRRSARSSGSMANSLSPAAPYCAAAACCRRICAPMVFTRESTTAWCAGSMIRVSRTSASVSAVKKETTALCGSEKSATCFVVAPAVAAVVAGCSGVGCGAVAVAVCAVATPAIEIPRAREAIQKIRMQTSKETERSKPHAIPPAPADASAPGTMAGFPRPPGSDRRQSVQWGF